MAHNPMCEECEVELTRRVTTEKDPYRYTLSGLDNIGLVGISVWVCPRCKDESPEIPRLGELHRTIALDLIQKPALLIGPEIRYLRKFAGCSASAFAVLLGIDPAHLSRVENQHTASLGESTDRLVRAIAAIAQDSEPGRKALLALAQKLRKTSRRQKELFTLKGNHWRKEAA